MQHRGEIFETPVFFVALGIEAAGGEEVVEVGHSHRGALCLPRRLDGSGQGGVAKAIERLARGDHLSEERLQELHVLVDVVDQAEGIERERGVFGELDEVATEVAARFFVGAAHIDDPDTRACAKVGSRNFVEEKGLAGAGGAGDRHVVVADRIVVDIDPHDLAAAATEEQHRRSGALPFADEWRQVNGIG